MVPDEHLGLFAPSSWQGEDGYFSISTQSRLDLSLNGAGLRVSGLELLRDRGGFQVHAAPEVVLLGVTRPAGEITTFASASTGNVFGTLGCLFFSGSVLAFDPAGPHVALAPRAFNAMDEAFHRVRIIGDSGLPVTTDVRLSSAPDVQLTTLISTATPRTYLSAAAAAQLPRRAVRPGRPSRVELAAGVEIAVELGVEDVAPHYVVPLLADPVGLVIGLDVLRRFLTVFDFAGGEIGFRGYPGAI